MVSPFCHDFCSIYVKWLIHFMLVALITQILTIHRHTQYVPQMRTYIQIRWFNQQLEGDTSESAKSGKMGKMAWSICKFDFGLFILLWGTDFIWRETREDFTIRCRLLRSSHTVCYCCDLTIPIDSKHPHVPFSFTFFSCCFSSTNRKLNQSDVLWHGGKINRERNRKTDTKIWLIEISFFYFCSMKERKRIVEIYLCIWSVKFGKNQSKMEWRRNHECHTWIRLK